MSWSVFVSWLILYSSWFLLVIFLPILYISFPWFLFYFIEHPPLCFEFASRLVSHQVLSCWLPHLPLILSLISLVNRLLVFCCHLSELSMYHASSSLFPVFCSVCIFPVFCSFEKIFETPRPSASCASSLHLSVLRPAIPQFWNCERFVVIPFVKQIIFFHNYSQ